MRKTSHRSYYVHVICVIAIVGAFSISSLVIVTMGGHLYRSMEKSNESSNKVRIALAYATEKIREMDAAGAIEIDKRMDRNVLIMKKDTPDEDEETLLYFKDGTLYEAKRDRKRKDHKIQEKLGQAITRVDFFTITQIDHNLIQFTASDKGGYEESIIVNLRSGR